MFNLKEFSYFFLKGSSVYNYTTFIEDKSLHSDISYITKIDTSKFDEIERCNILLKDGRVLKNFFIVNKNMLLFMTYWSNNGGLVHDAVEKYLFETTKSVFNEYTFKEDDIVKLEITKIKLNILNFYRQSANDLDMLPQVVV